MFIDPIIKRQVPKGVNAIAYHCLQKLWSDTRHVSNYTPSTMMRGVNFHASVAFDNNEHNYTIIQFQ